MNNPSQIFEDHLDKGEIIIDKWYLKDGSFSYPVTFASFVIGLFLIFFFDKTSFYLLSVAGIFITMFSVINLLTKLQYLESSKGYSITTRKIIILNSKYIPRYIPFEKIYNMKIAEISEGKYKSREVIKIYLEPETSILPHHEMIEISGKPKYILSKFKQHWKKYSPYNSFYQEINQFLKQNKLQTVPISHDYKKNIIIERKINDSRLMINISDSMSPKKLQVEINCKNEEGNYLLLKNEYIQDRIKKNIGMQDLIIGDAFVDERFIIQSNYEPFIQHILDKDSLAKIKDSENSLNFTISMGDKVKMKKPNHLIKENQTLDEHLLGIVNKKIRIKEKESILRLRSNNLRDIKNYKTLGSSLVKRIELLLYFAEKINEYNEGNITN